MSQSHSTTQETTYHIGSLPTIPEHLRPEEEQVYQDLVAVHQKRLKDNRGPQRVFVISDIALDYDDLVAWVILKELHRLKLIELKGFVTNLQPSYMRARYGRGALDTLGLQSVPVATGLSGLTGEALKKHRGNNYQFMDCSFMAKYMPFPSGEELLGQALLNAEKENYKIRLLLISSLQDIVEFSKIKEFSTLLEQQVSHIDMQGGYELIDGKLIPNLQAANNSFDLDAANTWHHFMQAKKISSTVYTKVAVFSHIPIHPSLFEEIAATGHPVGKRLLEAQLAQEKDFYATACEKDETKRFRPFMDQTWYLKNKTTWWTAKNPDGSFKHRKPLFGENGEVIEGTGDWPKLIEDVYPFLDVLLLYDALPALGCVGEDVLDALHVLDLSDTQKKAFHKVVGVEGKPGAVPPVPEETGICKDKMAVVLRALIKGSILACQQGLSSVDHHS